MSRPFAYLLLALLAALVGVATIATAKDVAPPSLAARINGACQPGYVVADWRVRDGIVEVTCESARHDRYGLPVRSYRAGVDR